MFFIIITQFCLSLHQSVVEVLHLFSICRLFRVMDTQKVLNYKLILFLFLFHVSLTNAQQYRQQNPTPVDVICSLPPSSGCGRRYSTYYFYDANSKQCFRFSYSGVGGNLNRFTDEAFCKRFCCGSVKALKSPDFDDPSEVCQLPLQDGRCYNMTQRYFFDFNAGICRSFIYSGCNGNGNNFATEENCQHVCSKYMQRFASTTKSVDLWNQETPFVNWVPATTTVKTTTTPFTIPWEPTRFPSPLAPRCLLPLQRMGVFQPGCENPRGPFYRFYYNSATKVCQLFWPWGCFNDNDHSQNRFNSLQECRDVCEPPIQRLPQFLVPQHDDPPAAARGFGNLEDVFQPLRCQPNRILDTFTDDYAICRTICKERDDCIGFVYNTATSLCQLAAENCLKNSPQLYRDSTTYFYIKLVYRDAWVVNGGK